ncbi:MAG TPA: hypothetical protein VEG32_13935 [Clostridia bacterium]|nr:hypothetical protein [Clostridia bacterium]
MKTKLSAVLALALVFTLASFASQTAVTGILTDDMCTKKHMMPGKPNADCVRECIKHGAKYVVVSGGKVFVLKGNPEEFSPLAGKKVKITGEQKGDTFTVASIEAAQ